MNPRPDPALVHARALRGRGSTLPPGFTPPAEILESWARCLDHGLDFAARIQLPVVGGAELARRRDSVAPLRRLARAELDTLMQQIAGSNFLLAFGDADGVILDVVTDNRFQMQSSEDIVAGSSWREELAGTNGLGTALASGRCVAVTGAEHYYLRLADISCTASPIRDAGGDVVGLLDASSYVESRQHHTRALVQMAASHIENVLLTEQRSGDFLIAIHPRREFLRTISAGLLAFDAEGLLTALNSRAQALLAGLNAARGVHFDQLFAERFDRFVARMHGQSDVRLNDALGSALVARWVARRPTVAARVAAAMAPADQLPAASDGATASGAAGPAFVAEDPMVAGALHTATQAARMKLPLLLCGESGTGKTSLALAAHAAAAAAGRRGAFVTVQCGAMSAETADSALVGQAGQPGLVQNAHGGTLVLEQIDALPLPAQAWLLQLFDMGLAHAAAGGGARGVDLLWIATTTLDLEAEVSARRFRADLLSRLGTVRVQLPPLARRADVGACASTLLGALAPHGPVRKLAAGALAMLSGRAWPGNLHELRSLLARALLTAGSASELDIHLLDPLLPAPQEPGTSVLQRQATARVLAEIDRHHGSISKAARALGVSRTTIYRHLRQAGRASPN